jgi:hypothetical protein
VQVQEASTDLAEAVEAVRAELLRAKELGSGSSMEFEVGPVEMQFTVVLTREGKANAGVKVWVIEAGASGTLTGQRTHQVKITLHPKRPDGRPERIGASADDFK